MGVFRMPSLGSDMEGGKLVEWLVAPGDTVTRGDVIAVVETQKGAIEIECFEEGTVRELQADLDQDLPVGAPMALILAAGEQDAAPTPEPPATPAKTPEPAFAKPVAVVAPTAAPPSGRTAASPAARVRAGELSVDLATLEGSGPGGAVLLADVEGASAPKHDKPAKRLGQMDEMRKAIAAAMTRSKQTIPHYYLSETIDVQPALDWLAARNEGAAPDKRILLGALMVRAAVLAAMKVKVMNGHFIDGAFHAADGVNAGVAVALRGGGLVAPALIGADRMSLDETMAGMRDLVSRARAGRLRSSEMTEGTITISSLGETGAEAMTGVIFPPQVALVGIGAPHVRPWIVDGAVAARTVVTMTLSADHRASDGRQAARFINDFETRIASPETL
ncbi:dihydrolipoamide acetyltransferase family protein [Psychromarinibacter sp. S121]|uniref:dihydrolipoamide acetyltransferase family protein n=1 Tax=Psychromarinibacter sp. S121 TaxID=3415127 RepID=UPI003C7A1F24